VHTSVPQQTIVQLFISNTLTENEYNAIFCDAFMFASRPRESGSILFWQKYSFFVMHVSPARIKGR
jgi:hypothetical protein